MAKKRDPLGLTPHWHVDCRLEAELPEDNVIRTQFLINTLFGSAALVSVIVAGWLAYKSISLRKEISDWKSRIIDDSSDVQEIKRDQVVYQAEAAKIEQAASLIKTPFLVSELAASFSRTLPPSMFIDSIEWNETGVILTGTVPSLPEFRNYFKALQEDPKIAPLFKEILQGRVDPARNQQSYVFTVKLILQQ